MDIQSLSMTMSQAKIEEEAAVRVQAMVMRNVKDSGAALAEIIQSAEPISDPAQGNLVDRYM